MVEAAAGSGSLITARCALEQNRPVMAVPGTGLSGRNRGAHALLKDGDKQRQAVGVEALRLVVRRALHQGKVRNLPVELNQQIGTDFPWCSVFTPYPRTPLGERCVAEGRVREDFSFDRVSAFYFDRTPLVQPDIDAVLNLQRLFAIAVKKPGLRPLLDRLVRLPPNPAFDACSVALHAWLHVYKLFDMDARELADLAFRTLPAWLDHQRGPGGSKPC